MIIMLLKGKRKAEVYVVENIGVGWRMHVCFGFYHAMYLVRSAWIVYAGLILDRYDQ